MNSVANPEVLRLAVDIAPAAIAAGGFAVSRLVVFGIQRSEEAERQAPNETVEAIGLQHLDFEPAEPVLAHEEGAGTTDMFRQVVQRQTTGSFEPVSEVEQSPVPQVARNYSRESRMGRMMLRSLPYFAAAMTYVSADAMINEGRPVGDKPAVAIVVDRSGATKYAEIKADKAPKSEKDASEKGKATPATVEDATNAMIAEFYKRADDITSTVYIARGNEVEETTLQQAYEEPDVLKASGNAPMKGAFRTALSRMRLIRAKDEADRKSAGVVVLTNGNTYASKAGAKSARKAHVPVSTVNFGDSDKGDVSEKLAKQTKGAYFEAGDSPEKVVDKVISSLDPARVEKGIDINLLPPLTLFAVGFGLALRELRHMPITFRGIRDIMKSKRS